VPKRRQRAHSRNRQDRQRQLQRRHVRMGLPATRTRVGTFLAAIEQIEGSMGWLLTDHPLLLDLARKLQCSCQDCCGALCRSYQIGRGACQASGSLENPIVIRDCSNSVKVYKE
jgi:hypothetical protein